MFFCLCCCDCHCDWLRQYRQAAEQYIGDPLASHLKTSTASGQQYITECPASGVGGSDKDACTKTVDGAVILSLIHSGWLHNDSTTKMFPTSVAVANTVAEYNGVFCKLYPINTVTKRAHITDYFC